MFTREIHTECEIDAPPETVWAVLTDFTSYGEWNPHVTAAAGRLEEGAPLALELQYRGDRQSLTARVTAVDPPHRLQWVGTVLGSWLFEGQHTFELHPLDGDRTRFVNRERVSGLTAPLIVRGDAAAGYESMNRALADRVASHTWD